MAQVAKSDQSTGNQQYASYVMKSHDVLFAFTAPYSKTGIGQERPEYSRETAQQFSISHGFAARAIGITVDDAAEAYEKATKNGAVGVLNATTLVNDETGQTSVISEIKLFDDTVLRFVQLNDYDGPFLPHYSPVDAPDVSYGIKYLDHIVSNVPELIPAASYLINALGFHEFAEFVAADVGTVDSGLNSMVLANNSEHVLLPINEPTFGTRRKSQIQTYLEQNEGAGIQHIALKTDNIVETMRELKKRKYLGGFDFMPRASDGYYAKLATKFPELGEDLINDITELGLLADKDDQGILLQVFTKPLGDRPTVFIEIIQRIGCMEQKDDGTPYQAAACGGFGKGNFSELFKSIEDYETARGVNTVEVAPPASPPSEGAAPPAASN
jgi:4-hydroxyphenylpyruvate dioxygenase